jgi:hypothetical protein
MDCILLGASDGECSGGKNKHRVNNVKLLECLPKFWVLFCEVFYILKSGDSDRANATDVLLCADISWPVLCIFAKCWPLHLQYKSFPLGKRLMQALLHYSVRLSICLSLILN